jgi:periplasmic divalent cation tolerance protein
MNVDSPVVVISTTADKVQAKDLGRVLVEKGLAACVSVIPAVESIYSWQGKVEHSTEVMMIAKTTMELSNTLTEELAKIHPYDTPEIIVIPVSGGFQPYLSWIAEVTTTSRTKVKKDSVEK